jgi:cytosine/adenosine deaminase-related metal-dependent hydrolase
MAVLVEAGIPLLDVWALATRGSARALGVQDHGTIRPGAPADLLIFRDDPTRDLAALVTLEAVIAGGRLYSRAAIDAGLARYQKHFDSWLFDTLSTMLTKRVMGQMFAADAPPDHGH